MKNVSEFDRGGEWPDEAKFAIVQGIVNPDDSVALVERVANQFARGAHETLKLYHELSSAIHSG